MKPKIVIVGGGSINWTPPLVKDMMLTDRISEAEFVLFDINKKAADLTQAFLEKVARKLQVNCVIKSTDRRATAFKAADYFIIAISVGGLTSMAADLSIPEKYGIYHTVGDTSGPGGWARTLRHFKVFYDLAQAIQRYAPGAVVLNYTNPMSTLTHVLAQIYDGPVVGLCHGLFENIEFIKDFYALDSEDQISLRYGGLNHFFWTTRARVGQVDVLADLQRRLQRKSLSELLPVSQQDPMGFSSGRDVADELFRMTGVMPYLGDRHTCEFFPWYITDRDTMKKYRIKRTSIATRKRNFQKGLVNLKKMIKGKIGKSYLQRSRETAADIIAAHALGKVFIDVGNLPNSGQIGNLPTGTTVETAMRVDRNGFSPIVFGDLPDSVLAWVDPWARVYDLTVKACFHQSKAMALQALRLDPLCAHLDTPRVHQMGERLLHAHRRYIELK